jgi:ABC-2 type transport system permease protein
MYTMRHRHKRPSLLAQMIDLFLMELTNWRWSWRTLVLTGTITPMLGIVALGVFAHNAGRETQAYILTGNVVLSLMFGNLEKVQSRFVYMRFTGALDYFATLPVQRYMLILAILFSFLLLSLPSLIVTIIFGSLFLGIPLALNSLILVTVPLCAIPLAAIGALIGTSARTPESAGSISLLVTFLLVGLGPVVIPPNHLPRLMILLGYLSPATYAASALRQTLLGPLTGEIVIDLALLAAFGIVSLWVVGRRMDWRQK